MKKLSVFLIASIFGLQTAIQSQTKIKVACIGNSITAGATVDLNYPKILGTLLGFNYTVYNFGKSGATLRFSQASAWIKETTIVNNVKSTKPDIVIIKLGTNDAGGGSGIAAEFKADYLKLVDSVISWSAPGAKIYVCYPIPIFSNPTSDAVITGTIIPAIADVSIQKGVEIIDLNTRFKGHSELCVADGIHPTAEGFQAIAKVVFDSIKIVVTKITVSVSGGGSPVISINGGKLQMQAAVEPTNATNPYVKWSVENVTGSATITALGSLTAKANGTVKVVATATDSSGIKGELTVTISNQSDIQETSMKTAELYPNPAKDQVSITGLASRSAIELVNQAGITLLSVTTVESSITLDVSSLKAGVYHIKISNSSETKTITFIKD